LLLHFNAAATHAEVWWNDVRLGEHLGGWTPFRFDVTELVRKNPNGPHTISVKLDEKVGHNTQGFLPIIQPHFGGLWQEVKIIDVAESYIDDLDLYAFGDWSNECLVITARLVGPSPPKGGSLRYRLRGGDWSQPQAIPPAPTEFPHTWFLRVRDHKKWSHEHPDLYEVEITWGEDRITTTAAFRTIDTKGRQLLLNGQPLIVRGVLNWGYYPPRLAPIPDRDRWRRDIRLAKSMGFNLMKFCLWLPPREFFELCDQEGMLVWQEYPTWHPKLDEKHRTELVREFSEFFAYDRNHPSVILRSLTCETGRSADVNVIRELYDLAKKMIPGCVVEDDSSWIEWHRIHDFYDDHPYGNNHTWVATLKRLNDHIAKHGAKPLLLGEAIAADTWVDPEPLLKKVGTERPYWLPGFLDGNKKWLDRMRSLYGGGGLNRLSSDSKRYAHLMRKFQIETYRREVPDGGYVVSVLRDFPLAGMGLVDYHDQPKWAEADWTWHRPPIQVLKTPNDSRSAIGGDQLNAAVVSTGAKTQQFMMPTHAVVRPERRVLPFEKSEWPIWIVPPREPDTDSVQVVRRLDPQLLDRLEAGAKVLLLPDGEKGSLPLRNHWFLRGGPYLPDHPLWERIPREMIVDLQHFDLAGPVIPDFQLLDEIDPLVLLWDNHDIKEVKTHALVFETRVGKGRLFVSALRHDGDENAAGQWLLGEFTRHAAAGPLPKRSLKPETIRRMRDKLREKKLDLTKETWRFKPDPNNSGVGDNWHAPDLKLDDSWKSIRVGKHWEGQGWPNLDGWAWYRLDVVIPTDWAGSDTYLSFEGVDDHYEVFVNGTKIGAGGDPQTKRTAFDERASYKITPPLKPGERCSIAIRVFDWYGAGGIHRPVTLSTSPFAPGADFLR
jgi:hypothetical protein